MFNSRTLLANGYKSALRQENYRAVESFLLAAKGVLLSMTDMTGKQDTTSLLNVASTDEVKPFLTFETALCDHTYSSINIGLTTFVEGINGYIAVWVAQVVSRVLHFLMVTGRLFHKVAAAFLKHLYVTPRVVAKIIPVLRRGEEIPASLRFINYIDARDDIDDTDVVNKFARAVAEGLEENYGPYSVTSNESKINGDGISISSQMDGRLSRTYKTALIKEHLDAAKHLGLKATVEFLEIIWDMANQSSLFAHPFWYYTHFGRFLIFAFDNIAIVLISYPLLVVYTLGRVEMVVMYYVLPPC
ncbi:hypothetical protein LSH36_669g02027 [Paralvinella palmiformis]|uniref:Uncharacterized protein n=1 Tax=Paralvinella palmiformis TaxID=53620 RepID=A0AAD9J415_9ANNE|nr:hypothetical protein LSH36_669g02027 [Paralvinella palmiformis]